MKKTFFRVSILIFLILPAYLTFFANKNQIRSVPVINLKDQMSNAQLSFFGRLSSTNGSIINIATGTGNPSQTTANLFAGDTLAIANVGVTSSTLYVVRDVGNTAAIELATNIGTTTTNSYIIATRSAIHVVSFTPQAAVSGEKWQFLIRATSRIGESNSDGMPDQVGFDLGALTTADVACPGSATPTIGTTTIVTNVSTGYTGAYHVIQCAYALGSSNAGATTITIGRDLAVGKQIINPSPDLSHTPGQANNTADTHAFAIRQLDNSNNIIDTTFGKLAITESVRVTAIIDPTITFTIGTSNTVSVGTTLCGSPLSNGAPNTIATAVSFGPLVLGNYNNLAQSLHCTTNSQNGYVIQAFENRPLTMLGTTVTIPNTTCPSNSCTTSSAANWSTYSNSGFGYSLEVGTTTGVATNVTMGIASTGLYKPFGVGYANAQPILSRTDTPGSTDSIYICYRATASTVQQAGTYENSVSFIATATF